MNSPISRRDFLKLAGAALATPYLPRPPRKLSYRYRPNIVHIIAEDIGPDLGCYGQGQIQTPHLDRLAAEGARFNQAFCPSPVCSPARSAMLTGVYPHTINAHQHRTIPRNYLPPDIHPITHLLRASGYFTAIGCGFSQKLDVNFKADNLFDARDWRHRQSGQPFYAQITLSNTHRPWRGDRHHPVEPDSIDLPPYYPDHVVIRRDFSNYLEEIQNLDRHVGQVLDRIEREGLAQSTVIIFTSDNGRAHVRSKQFLYDSGVHIPLLMRWPGVIRPGTVREDLVSSIDIPTTALWIGGATLPDYLQGQILLAPSDREYIFAARDRCDETHDAIRMVRSARYKYIRNLMPERAYCQYNRYKERRYPALAVLNVLNLQGALQTEQALFMQPFKPSEELYDLTSDPHELHNLVGDPDHHSQLVDMRAALDNWQALVGDHEILPEYRLGGWSDRYPTRSLAEWQEILKDWQNHLLHRRPPPRIATPKMGQSLRAAWYMPQS